MPSEEIRAAIAAAVTDPRRVAAASRMLQAHGGLRSLDRLTALACRIVRSSNTHVTVRTDRLAIVSRSGRSIPELKNGDLSTGLCNLTAMRGTTQVLDDAQQDQHAAALPIVRSGAVRGYLGIPLKARNGTVIGSLCSLVDEPRLWSDEHVHALTDLADAVTAELELAAVASELGDASARLRLILEAGQIGSFEMDLVTGEISWDERLATMFGYSPEHLTPSIDAITARVHPDDVDLLAAAVETALSDHGEYEIEYRVRAPGRGNRWVRNRGRVIAGPDGRPARLVGAAHDATRTREADTQVARLLETLPAGFAMVDGNARITYVNAAGERLLGTARSQLVGQSVWEAFPFLDRQGLCDEHSRLLRSDEAIRVEGHHPGLDVWFEIRVWPSDEGFRVTFDDITERRQIVTERRLALAAQQRALRSAERATRHLAVLADASAAMGATLEESSVAEILVAAVVPQLGSWARVEVPAATGTGNGEPVDVTREQGVLAADASAATRFSMSFTSRNQAPLGTLTVQLRDVDDQQLEDVRRLLVTLADRAAAAIDKARLYAAQRNMSEVLQRSMLTRLPDVPGLEIVARYRPSAAHAHVGGDWYDAFLQPDGRTVVVIGDVFGHDRHAAAAMGQLRNLLRGLTFDHGIPPSEILGRVDQTIQALDVDCLATALVACIEPSTTELRRVEWASAGHLPPVVLRHDGPVALLDQPDNLLLGLERDVERRDRRLTLGTGDILFLYTDGLVERRDRTLSQALDGLVAGLETLSRHHDISLDGLSDHILEELVPADPYDDIATIAVRPR